MSPGLPKTLLTALHWVPHVVWGRLSFLCRPTSQHSGQGWPESGGDFEGSLGTKLGCPPSSSQSQCAPQRCLVRVAFQPTLPHQLVIQEALETVDRETQSTPVCATSRQGGGWGGTAGLCGLVGQLFSRGTSSWSPLPALRKHQPAASRAQSVRVWRAGTRVLQRTGSGRPGSRVQLDFDKDRTRTNLKCSLATPGKTGKHRMGSCRLCTTPWDPCRPHQPVAGPRSQGQGTRPRGRCGSRTPLHIPPVLLCRLPTGDMQSSGGPQSLPVSGPLA